MQRSEAFSVSRASDPSMAAFRRRRRSGSPVTVKMTGPMLDTFWGLLDGKSKAALLSKMGAE